MTVYRQNQLRWACIMVVELTIGMLALYVSAWFAVPFLALVFVIPSALKGLFALSAERRLPIKGDFSACRYTAGSSEKSASSAGGT
jgi:hypothetical protein